jgi:hypothetical protein
MNVFIVQLSYIVSQILIMTFLTVLYVLFSFNYLDLLFVKKSNM